MTRRFTLILIILIRKQNLSTSVLSSTQTAKLAKTLSPKYKSRATSRDAHGRFEHTQIIRKITSTEGQLKRFNYVTKNKYKNNFIAPRF